MLLLVFATHDVSLLVCVCVPVHQDFRMSPRSVLQNVKTILIKNKNCVCVCVSTDCQQYQTLV